MMQLLQVARTGDVVHTWFALRIAAV